MCRKCGVFHLITSQQPCKVEHFIFLQKRKNKLSRINKLPSDRKVVACFKLFTLNHSTKLFRIGQKLHRHPLSLCHLDTIAGWAYRYRLTGYKHVCSICTTIKSVSSVCTTGGNLKWEVPGFSWSSSDFSLNQLQLVIKSFTKLNLGKLNVQSSSILVSGVLSESMQKHCSIGRLYVTSLRLRLCWCPLGV